MAVPRYSFRVMYVVREGYSNQAMNHLVKQAKTGEFPTRGENPRHTSGGFRGGALGA